MNMKLLTWVALNLSIFAIIPALNAQQPAANPAAVVSPTQAGTEVRPPLNARDVAIDRAKILMAEKRYDAGILAYGDLLKSEPKNALFMNMIGIAYLNMSNYGQAKKYFERAVKADKSYSSAVNNLGMVAYQQKNYRRAIREYQRAVTRAARTRIWDTRTTRPRSTPRRPPNFARRWKSIRTLLSTMSESGR